MKPSDELFKLIRSLSKSEKRFFKLTSTLQAGDKNYIKLFDAIEKQKEYDEDSIKLSFKGETFIHHLPSEKNHLFKLILKSLRSFHADSTVSSILQEEIKNVEILHQKALYKECAKIIKRAKTVAYDHERFYYLFVLLGWEKSLLEDDYHAGYLDRDLDEVIAEEYDVLEKLRNLAEYKILYSKINYVFRKGGYARNDRERKIVEEIENYHLIKGKNTALSKTAAANCYYIQGLCAIVNHDYEKSFEKFQRVAKIFETNPVLIQEIPKQYVKSLCNLLLCYADKNDYVAFFSLNEKIRALILQPGFESVDVRLTIFTSTYLAELIVYDLMGDYSKGATVISDIIVPQMEEFGDRITKEEEILFYYHFAYNCFGNAQYKDSLHWINKILNDTETNVRQDIYSFARIFSLIIHYELGNLELIDYLQKSVSRYYLKRKSDVGREFRVELAFLKHLKKLIKSSPTEAKEVFKELKSDIQKALKNNYEQMTLKYFDFNAWVDSKLQNETFAEAKKQQIEKR